MNANNRSMSQEPKIEVYSGDYCPYCTRAKQLLEQKGYSYVEILVDQSKQEKEKMIERTGGRRTIPQIFINDYHVGGCDDLYALEGKGKLDELLGKR